MPSPLIKKPPTLFESERLESFGPYILLHRLGTGGMANIFIARPAVISANGRLVVIKRLLPQLTLDPEFLQMFESETQLCMGLTHPNIVQIYDFGRAQGPYGTQPYIAMEYLDGRNLRQILNQFLIQKQLPPVSFALSVCSGAAAGLHGAHTYTDPLTGQPLNIVHRDISPQNILVTFDGNSKLIDFGIAKGAVQAQTDSTRTGTIKGKISYIAPEQTLGYPADPRTDVFSLGCVLWELLTGRKLFLLSQGESELEILNRIRTCELHILPPSKFNPLVTPELDALVLKAIKEKKEDRYQSAEEFQIVIRDYLLKHFPGFSYRDVGGILKILFQTARQEERNILRKLNEEAQTNLEQGRLSEQTLSGPIKHEFEFPELEVLKKDPHSNHRPSSLTNSTSSSRSTSHHSWLISLSTVFSFLITYIGVNLFYPEKFKSFSTTSTLKLALTPKQGSLKSDLLPQIQDSLILNVRVQPEEEVAGIYINGVKLHERRPAAKIPLDQQLELKIEKANGMEPIKRTIAFPSRAFKGVKSHTLNLYLEDPNN